LFLNAKLSYYAIQSTLLSIVAENIVSLFLSKFIIDMLRIDIFETVCFDNGNKESTKMRKFTVTGELHCVNDFTVAIQELTIAQQYLTNLEAEKV